MQSSGPSLSLFGGVFLRSPDGSPAALPGRKTQRLLAMLALGPARGLCRESLAEALWPGADPTSSRKALATELWRLRATLSAAGLQSWLMTDNGRVGLSETARTSTDVAAFEAALALARTGSSKEQERALASAEALYTGEFMAGDADEWCIGRRAYYAALHADLHFIGIRRAREAADWVEVIRHGQALAEAEPLFEEAQQELMRAHLALGNRPAALAVYRSLELALADELGLKPSEETRHLRLAALPPRFSPRRADASASLADRLRGIASEIERLEAMRPRT
ncbi:MAG: BTAD domain-containing putative transcriptional regulator [Beijerinckiaceae bacterium]|jgi:DNA-binding SARP family transcriptional activator|nr:BTAD domain-containing putative transcriptional regulator [Beijerinckiaceae bacterium]